jgi:hypothetical protein
MKFQEITEIKNKVGIDIYIRYLEKVIKILLTNCPIKMKGGLSKNGDKS